MYQRGNVRSGVLVECTKEAVWGLRYWWGVPQRQYGVLVGCTSEVLCGLEYWWGVSEGQGGIWSTGGEYMRGMFQQATG